MNVGVPGNAQWLSHVTTDPSGAPPPPPVLVALFHITPQGWAPLTEGWVNMSEARALMTVYPSDQLGWWLSVLAGTPNQALLWIERSVAVHWVDQHATGLVIPT